MDAGVEARWLADEMAEMRVVDAHEHLPRESTRLAELYRPGLYERVLGQVCNIGAVLQNSDDPAYGDPLLRPVAMTGIGGEWHSFPDLAGQIVRGEQGFASLDDYLEERRARMRRLKELGVAAFKHTAHLYCDPDPHRAGEVFTALRGGDERWTRTSVPNPLWNYLTDQLLAAAGELDLPVCVHTGVWGDFRELAATEMVPHIARHPEVRFDLFHMGLPAVREMGRIGANFGNVWLNMCWAHTVSPTMAASALDEWLDQVGVNKIIAFGGDVRWPVEKVYGHLALAREVVATVLGRRITAGLMGREEALGLGRRFFLENPAELYRLERKECL